MTAIKISKRAHFIWRFERTYGNCGPAKCRRMITLLRGLLGSKLRFMVISTSFIWLCKSLVLLIMRTCVRFPEYPLENHLSCTWMYAIPPSTRLTKLSLRPLATTAILSPGFASKSENVCNIHRLASPTSERNQMRSLTGFTTEQAWVLIAEQHWIISVNSHDAIERNYPFRYWFTSGNASISHLQYEILK